MNVNLTAELEQLVQHKVESGLYHSASEVVRDALQLLADRDRLMDIRKNELHEKIVHGLDSLRSGETLDGEQFFAQLEQEEKQLEHTHRSA